MQLSLPKLMQLLSNYNPYCTLYKNLWCLLYLKYFYPHHESKVNYKLIITQLSYTFPCTTFTTTESNYMNFLKYNIKLLHHLHVCNGQNIKVQFTQNLYVCLWFISMQNFNCLALMAHELSPTNQKLYTYFWQPQIVLHSKNKLPSKIYYHTKFKDHTLESTSSMPTS